MDKERSDSDKELKTWHEPQIFMLNTKKTGGGFREASYEDSSYSNPTASP